MKKLGLLLALFALSVQAATFNLFSPATGVLKGNTNTYITSAAGSSDIIALWSGTCNASSFLRGDGACAAAGAGTVTSVAISAPSIFTVSGSPVTTTGTLTLTANGTSGGIPYFSASNALASSAALTANAITLGGGAGVAPVSLASLGTTTTLLHGNAAGAPTFAAVSLTADVTGVLPAANGGAVGANPTATVGLTAVNGTATTYTRSDGSPALDQTIVPTMTGVTWTWANAEPRLLFNETDQAANKKLWDLDTQGGHLIGRTRTDADGTGKIWLDVTRGSTTQVTNMVFGNTTDQPNMQFQSAQSTFFSNVQINGFTNVAAVNATGVTMGGSAASISGCTATSSTGGNTAGKFTSGTTGTCTVVITLAVTATNGYTCSVSDQTTANLMRQSANTTTSCTVSGTTVSGDVIVWSAIGW